MVAVKYGTIMATTGICITQYKKISNQYNPYVVAVIATVITVLVEAVDWSIDGMMKIDLYGLVPIVMLTWSMTVIFTTL